MYPVPTGELNALYLPFDETTKKRAWSYPLLDALSAPATCACPFFFPHPSPHFVFLGRSRAIAVTPLCVLWPDRVPARAP